MARKAVYIKICFFFLGSFGAIITPFADFNYITIIIKISCILLSWTLIYFGIGNYLIRCLKIYNFRKWAVKACCTAHGPVAMVTLDKLSTSAARTGTRLRTIAISSTRLSEIEHSSRKVIKKSVWKLNLNSVLKRTLNSILKRKWKSIENWFENQFEHEKNER